MNKIFLCGGNPPLQNTELIRVISEKKAQLKVVIFTIYRDNWKPYMERYYIPFLDKGIMVNPVYVLYDVEKREILLDDFLDADIIIIGGGDTLKYIDIYNTAEFKTFLRNALQRNITIIGFSAGALLLGKQVYISPNDNNNNEIMIEQGLGIYDGFSISVHTDSWDDYSNVIQARKRVDVPIYTMNDSSWIMVDDRGNIENFSNEVSKI